MYRLGQAMNVPEVWDSQNSNSRHMKIVKLSAIRCGLLYSPDGTGGIHFSHRLSRPQCHTATGSIMSMKISNVTIGNQTRDLTAWSAVPQRTAPPRAPLQPPTPLTQNGIPTLNSTDGPRNLIHPKMVLSFKCNLEQYQTVPNYLTFSSLFTKTVCFT